MLMIEFTDPKTTPGARVARSRSPVIRAMAARRLRVEQLPPGQPKRCLQVAHPFV